VQVEASFVYVDKMVHIARSMEDIFGPLAPTLNALGIVVSLWFNPHQLKRVGGEFVDGLVGRTLGKGRLDLEVLIQLSGEPLNRTTSKLTHILG